MKGNDLSSAERDRIAAQLSAYTGLPVPYLLKTNLRIEYGAFQKELLAEQATTVGTLDTRFLGATIDPLSKVASYDPQSAAISAAYVAAYNGYARSKLGYGEGIEFKSGISVYEKWDYKHEPPGAGEPLIALPNVMTDLAVAMKQNPDLKVMVNGGYYDVSTPYFAGKYEMRHLPVPANLLSNIEYRYYEAGHMRFLDPIMMRSARRYLRRMGHDQHLRSLRQPGQPFADRARHGSTDPAVNLVEDHRRGCSGLSERNLQRQDETRQFAARRNPCQRSEWRSGIGGYFEFDAIVSVRSWLNSRDRGPEPGRVELQRREFGGDRGIEPVRRRMTRFAQPFRGGSINFPRFD